MICDMFAECYRYVTVTFAAAAVIIWFIIIILLLLAVLDSWFKLHPVLYCISLKVLLKWLVFI